MVRFPELCKQIQRRSLGPVNVDHRENQGFTIIPRMRSVSFFVFVLALALSCGGCAKKLTQKGIPFELDRVFLGLFSLPQESMQEKGMRLAREARFHEAIEAFNQHLLENPDNFSGHNALAICYKNIGEHTKAMKNFEKSLELASSNEERAKVLSNIGNLYFGMGKYQVALGYYKEAQSETSRNPLYLVLIARTFILLDEYSRAKKVLASAEEICGELNKYEKDDDRGLGFYLMAQAYLALGDEQRVFEHLEHALKLNPDRFMLKLEQDTADEKNLLYTIRDDLKLRTLLQRRSSKRIN